MNTLELITTESNEPNLKYYGQIIHSNINPQQEALAEFQRINPDKNTIVLILGLGLGYLPRCFFLNSACKIIVYEPNPDILNFTLKAVDFTAELKSKRVFLAGSLPEVKKILEDNFTYQGRIELSTLNSSENLYKDQLHNLPEYINSVRSNLEANFNTLVQKSMYWLYYAMRNTAKFKTEPPLNILEKKFENRSALIVSAGPSLDKNIEVIKTNRDKFLIFCVNVAYKKLILNDIIPDFVLYIDSMPYYETITKYEHSKVNIIRHSTSYPYENENVNPNRFFTFYCKNDLFSRFVADTAGFSLDNYKNKGTVSYCALLSAFAMGCNPIILTGQDLAYPEGKLYASGSFWDLEDPVPDMEAAFKLKANDIKKQQLVKVKGQNGEWVVSSPDYAGFTLHFEEFAEDNINSGVKLINASTGGANIEGFINKPLQEVADSLETINLNVNETLDEIVTREKIFLEENFDKIKQHVKAMEPDIKKSIALSAQGLNFSKNLWQELSKKQKNLHQINLISKNIIEKYDQIDNTLLQKWKFMYYIAFKEITEFYDYIDDDSQKNNTEMFNNLSLKSRNLFERLHTSLKKIDEYYLKLFL